MRSDIQFSVFLSNKPGVLANVLTDLARAKVNVVALSMMDSMEHGVLRMVVDDADRARDVFAKLNVPCGQTEVMVIDMPNRPGSMADVCSRLAENHVNISYCYATTGVAGNRTLGVFKVADINKGLRVLAGRKPRREAPAVRSVPNARRGRRGR
jgi:hypothetical protein